MHGTTKVTPDELFRIEQPLLGRLPRVRFDTARCEPRRVGRFPLIERDAVFYSVPPEAKLANQRLDEVRRRVQNDTLGHRGRKPDPLFRCRRLLTKADERLDDRGRQRLLGLLEAGDPRGEVRMAWHAKEVVRSLFDPMEPEIALEFVTRLDLQDESCPPEVNILGRTITRWRHQIAAWHQAFVSNGPTEAVNNLIKVGRQAHRVRVHVVQELPHPRPALRRQAQLGPTRHYHPNSPVKSEAPRKRDFR